MIPSLLAQTAPDSGSPGYVVAAVVVSAVVVLAYLVIVALRVRDAANRLEALEQRLAREDRPAASSAGDATAPGVGEPEAVAAAARALGGSR